jgi:hypothetical protein
MMYQGVKDGHARFFITLGDGGAEFEFVPDPNGSIQSLILHEGGVNTPAKKR